MHKKSLRNLSEKLAAKFPATTLRGKNVFSEILELEASPVEGQSLPQNDKKKRKRKFHPMKF